MSIQVTEPFATGCPQVELVKGAIFLFYFFGGEKVAYTFFFLVQRLRKGGKQNILIIIQAIGLHKRFHSPVHQTLTVKTTNSVFSAIKHSEQYIYIYNKIYFPFA